jgi:branched-chain amino acid transport system substrate-binding protein
MKLKFTLLAAPIIALAFVAAAFARTDQGTGVASATATSPLCKTAGIGFAGPLTGGAAFLGADQRNWVRLFISNWNAGKAIPGVPKTMKRVKIQEALDGDSQLNPQVSATVAAQMTSKKSILGMVGFAGSNENLGGGPVLDRAGMAYISGSATADALTSGLKGFSRVVPNNTTQARVGATFLFTKLGLKKGDKAMVVDDAEAYGIGIANAAQAIFKNKGLSVDRESQVATNKDFTSLAQKAVAEGAKVVYAPSQVASDSQLFADQLKGANYHGIYFATDGSYDNTSFKFTGAYVSFFATDIYQVKIAKPFTAAFSKKYGKTTPFGAPSFVAAEVLAEAISTSCSDGKVSRAEVRLNVRKIKLSNTILGHPVAFTAKGEVKTGLPANGVTVFKIGATGSDGNAVYKLVYG